MAFQRIPPTPYKVLARSHLRRSCGRAVPFSWGCPGSFSYLPAPLLHCLPWNISRSLMTFQWWVTDKMQFLTRWRRENASLKTKHLITMRKLVCYCSIVFDPLGLGGGVANFAWSRKRPPCFHLPNFLVIVHSAIGRCPGRKTSAHGSPVRLWLFYSF